MEAWGRSAEKERSRTLPFSLVQAETSNQTCQALLNNERSYVNSFCIKTPKSIF
ncbi:MAG: hypothetical protein V7K38_09705 [Nostoc sp.]|uniref:hypothetical protein n=1 Tax=Nostoc sp. TaxID=1180 RepID=UPI002FF49D1E